MLIMAVCAVIAVNLSSCGIIKAAIKNITTDASSSDTATNNIHVYSIPPSSEYSSDFTSSDTSSTASSAVSSKSAESKASSNVLGTEGCDEGVDALPKLIIVGCAAPR